MSSVGDYARLSDDELLGRTADDRDHGNPDDGFQMDEFDEIPRKAQMPPRDPHSR